MLNRKVNFKPIGAAIRTLKFILTPTGTRGMVLILCLISSVAIVVVTAALTPTGSWQNTVGLSVSSSGVAATTVEIIIQITAKLDQSFKKRKFLTLFSYSDDDDKFAESTRIVIPAFGMKKFVADSDVNNSNNLKTRAIENLSRSDTKAAIKNDVIAGSFLVSMFPKFGLSTPKIAWDEESIDFNDSKESTYILIGLSNEKFDFFGTQNLSGKYFNIQNNRQKDNFNSFYIICKRDSVPDDSRVYFFPSDQSSPDVDYAIFAKFSYQKKTFLVCGGTTELGTSNIGWYINDQWERIHSKLEDKKGSFLSPNDSFAVVIEVPKDRQLRNFRIEHACI